MSDDIPGDSPVVDWIQLHDVSDNDPELLRELCDAFLEECDNDLETLGKALDAADSATARTAIHTLKGAAGTMGFVALMESAANFEERARVGNLDGSERWVADLADGVDRVRQAIRDSN